MTEYLFYSTSDPTRWPRRGAAQPFIALADAKRVVVPLPPLDTQRSIVAILSAYDSLIENNVRRIQILEEMARAVYREWFVEFRYPGHEDVPSVDSELGRIPSGWPVVALGECLSVDKGLSYKGAFLTDEGLPMANLKCFRPDGGFRRDGTKPYSGEHKAKHTVVAGDVIVANTDLTQAGRVIGCPAVVPRSGFERGGLISHHLFVVRPGPEQLGRSLTYHLLAEERFRGFARGRASGTTVLGFRAQDLLDYRFPLPPRELRERFADAVEPIPALAELLEDACANLRATRDLLLPRLISGEVDVSDLEIDTSGLVA